MIPEADWSKQKFITGRKVIASESNTDFNLRMPFDNFIGLEHLTKDNIFQEKGFNANDLEDGIGAETDLLWSWEAQDNHNSLNTQLAIAINVQTLLGVYRPLRGRYGVRLVVTGLSQTTDGNTSGDISKEAFFTNDDMYGNTYAYLTPSEQQKVFNISEDFISINSIKVYFWQEHNFFDYVGTQIPYNNIPPNIIFSGLEVYLGLSTDEINEEKVYLYTHDPLEYGEDYESTQSREELDAKELRFAWVHYDSTEEKYILINSSTQLTGEHAGKIYWYKQNWQAELDADAPAAARLGGANWEYLPEYDNQFTVTVVPSITKNKEKYKAIVHYTKTYTTSNIVTFENVRDVESIQEILAANSEMVFRFLRPATAIELERYKDREDSPIVYDSLIEDDGVTNFYVYDENNRTLKNSDEAWFSDLKYYVQIQIKVRDMDENGKEIVHYVPLAVGENVDDLGFEVEWYLPEFNSMTTSWALLDSTDPIQYGNPVDQENAKRTMRRFRIERQLDVQRINNMVSAKVSRNGRTYFLNRLLRFGTSDSRGTGYSVPITLVSPENYAMVQNNEFIIKAQVFDEVGNLDISRNYRFSWKQIGPSLIQKTKRNDGSENPSTSNWTIEDDPDGYYTGNVLRGYVWNSYPPIFEVTVYDSGAIYPISGVRGFMMVSNPDASAYQIICPERIEYKSDGSVPVYNGSKFIVQETETGEKKYPTWYIYQYNKVADVWNMVNQNQYLSLNEHQSGGQTVQTNNGAVYRVPYYEYSLSPTLRVLDNGQKIAWYWEESMKYNQYTYLSANLTTELNVSQSIAFDHNVYSSSLINSWDNTLNLDKENNAVLARMISAGTKDSQNRFTGVMMGDWKDKGDASLESEGLYGFQNGIQSFGFKTDGTGFIGQAGNGQITFDGNTSLISSYNKDFYINLNPMKYAYRTENGVPVIDWEKSTLSSYSPYFLYAKTIKTADTAGSLEEQTQWTSEFFQDDGHDYFIVDPNNGILTTGGVIARYGKIGNWMISSDGLYQKSSDLSFKPYMYLGYSQGDTEGYNEEWAALQKTYADKNAKLELDRDAAIGALEEHYNTLIQDEIEKAYQNSTGRALNLDILNPEHHMTYGYAHKAAAEFLQTALDNCTDGNYLKWIEDNIALSLFTNSFCSKGVHLHYDNMGNPEANESGSYWDCDHSVAYITGILLGYIPTFTALTATNQVNVKPTYKLSSIAPSGLRQQNFSYVTNVRMNPETSIIENIYADYYMRQLNNFSGMDFTAESAISYINNWEQAYQLCLTGYNIQNGYISQVREQYLELPENAEFKQAVVNYELALAGKIDEEEEKCAAAIEVNRLELNRERGFLYDKYHSRYAIYAGESEDRDGKAVEEPVFYVRWNGDLYARRGYISNTWVIDDNSLTYEKNNDIIYIGADEVSKNGTITYSSKGYAESESDPRKWVISAAANVLDKTSPYEINFGVSIGGELYAQLGTIGGWKIEKERLYIPDSAGTGHAIALQADGKISLANGNILLDGVNNKIAIGALTQPGQLSQGEISLAGFILQSSGREVTETIRADDIGTTMSSYRTALTQWNDIEADSGTVDANYIIEIQTGYRAEYEEESLTISGSQLNLYSNNGANIGLGILSGQSTVALTPTDPTFNVPDQKGWLLNWNLIGNLASVNELYTAAQHSNSIYMYMDREGGASTQGYLVATQDWVANVVAENLQRNIYDVNNAAAAAMRTARQGLAKANTAIQNIASWATNFDGKKLIDKVYIAAYNSAHAIYYDYYTVTADKDADGNVTGTVSFETGTDNSYAIWGSTINVGNSSNKTIDSTGTSISSTTKIDAAVSAVIAGINANHTTLSTHLTAYETKITELEAAIAEAKADASAAKTAADNAKATADALANHTHTVSVNTYEITGGGTTSYSTSEKESHSHTYYRRNSYGLASDQITRTTSGPK